MKTITGKGRGEFLPSIFVISKLLLLAVLLNLTCIVYLHAQSLEYGSPYVIQNPAMRIPMGLAVDTVRHKAFIVNAGNHRILQTNLPDLLGSPTWNDFGFVGDRTAVDALKEPQGLAVDATGNIYVADTYNHQVKLYRWNGASSTFAYDASFAATTRTLVAGKSIRFPRDIAVGTDGRIYLLDSGNDRILVATGPGDSSWEVWEEDASWGNPYGFDIASDHTIYLADTDNHRIIQLRPDGTVQRIIGHYGTGNVEFRNPRDVAIGTDGKIYVADTYNHRVVILKADATYYRNLGSAPLYKSIQKIEVDAQKHVYIVDSDNGSLIYFPGPGAPKPYDAYVRDYVGDDGTEPSNTTFFLSSPDILVRHHPDIDINLAKTNGLTSFAFEQPRFNENNYIYIAVRNRGNHLMYNVNLKAYWADPGSPLNFPEHWKTDGFYLSYLDATANTPGNSFNIPSISPPGSGVVPDVNSVVVIGPILWRPPAPETMMAGDGNVHLFVRLLQIDDPTEAATGIDQVRLNNNIALRKVKVERGPFPVGDQNTLVIKVQFPDVPESINETALTDKIEALGNWVKAVSYDLATLKPVHIGPILLDQPKTYYVSNPTNHLLVEMAQEAINKLAPALLDGATPDPEDDIDRVILVLNDPTYVADWATTGSWPYRTPTGGTRYLTVSVQGQANSMNQFAHGLSHQFGLQDLYPYANVVFPIAHPVDPWDNMAQPFNGVHPLTWSKQYATWVTSSYGKIHYIPRPLRGTTLTGQPSIHLSYQAILDSSQYGAIAIGLTEGATTFEEEHHFYWVEARRPSLGTYESTLPATGVLAYYANKLIPQGHVPVIVKDRNPTTPELNDATLTAGQSLAMGGTGIEVIVQSERPGDEGYNVVINFIPPATDFNVRIQKGDPIWISPDIWIDNQRDEDYASYDATLKKGNRVEDQPVGGEENRLFARVHNTGPGVAHDIEVEFRLSAPYHTVGSEGQFDLYRVVFIDNIASGDYKDVFVTWTPDAMDDPHNCVKVQLRRMVSDIDNTDDWAQQNFTVRNSTTASPYTEIAFPFQIKNTKDTPQLVYFRAAGIPKEWDQALIPQKKLLLPGEQVVGQLKVTPPPTYPSCTDFDVQVTAWTPENHTLVLVGGTTVDMQLRKQTEITLQTDVKPCGRQPVPVNQQVETSNHASYYPTISDNQIMGNPNAGKKGCAILTTSGCTNPVRPFEKIVVCYRDPAGNPVYREVMTDVNGCFQDFNIVVEGSTWETSAYYPGSNCSGPASSSVKVFVPIPTTGDQDNDGRKDEDEVQGDADGDGIAGQLDPDSDNDGMVDGKEPVSDLDQDGIENSNDPDSDWDTIPDGQDPLPYNPKHIQWEVNVFAGLFDFSERLWIRDTFTFGIRAGFDLPQPIGIEGELGITPTSNENNTQGYVMNANLNILKYFVLNNTMLKPFASAGVGGVWFNGFGQNSSATTLNAGLGVKYQLNHKVLFRADAKLFNFTNIYQVKHSKHTQITKGLSYRF